MAGAGGPGVPPGFTGILGLDANAGDVNKAGYNSPGIVLAWASNPMLVKEAVVRLRQKFDEGGSERPAWTYPDDAAAAGFRGHEGPTYYEVLEVDKGGDETAIKKSYRKLVLLWHPDKHPANREEADEKIRLINAAYETLGNPVKRAGYDQMLEAIERKKRGARLDTSFIKPRMSIPKEFFLCPLGHPDKFVRAVGSELRVQSREDVNANFSEFFSAAKFTLWWLPEVNNMCRIRTAESAQAGVEGGNMLNFLMDGTPTGRNAEPQKDADTTLRMNEDPRYTNVIAVASPFSPGAFRFEGAFWPGHYLCFRAPSSLKMAGLVDEVKDVTDFYLVDYSAAYKTMTISEALLGPVKAQGNGDYVKLGDLRADLGVRMFFQNTLGCAVWNNREFELFFEGHYAQWDYDKKRARVRPRTAGQQLSERLRRAKKQEDVAQAVANAGEELDALALDLAEKALGRLVEAPSTVAVATRLRDLPAARRKLLAALPRICSSCTEGVPLPTLLGMRRSIQALAGDEQAAKRGEEASTQEATAVSSDAKVDGKAGPHPDGDSTRKPSAKAEKSQPSDIAAQREAAAQLLVLAVERARTVPAELDPGALRELAAAPLHWEVACPQLCAALEPLFEEQTAAAPGTYLEPLRYLLQVGKPALAVAEAVGRQELRTLPVAKADVAVLVLTSLVDADVLIPEVLAMLRPPVLQQLPLPELVKLVAKLGERGASADAGLKVAIQSRIQPSVVEPQLAAVPQGDLMRLANASKSSKSIEEFALGPLAGAAAGALGDWRASDIARLLELIVESKVAASSTGGERFVTRAIFALPGRLKDLDGGQLASLAVTIRSVEACKPLFEVSLDAAVDRMEAFSPAELLTLTEATIQLDMEHEVVTKVTQRWSKLLAAESDGDVKAADGRAQADDAARLAELLAKELPGRESAAPLMEACGARLLATSSALTEEGRRRVEAAFPGGAGPAFAGKEKLLAAIRPAKDNGKRSDGRGSPRGRRREGRGSPEAARRDDERSAATRRRADRGSREPERRPDATRAEAQKGGERERRDRPQPRERAGRSRSARSGGGGGGARRGSPDRRRASRSREGGGRAIERGGGRGLYSDRGSRDDRSGRDERSRDRGRRARSRSRSRRR